MTRENKFPETQRVNEAARWGRTIVLAGATGALGGRIAYYLLQRGATVKALVRPATAAATLARLHDMGATIVETDYADATALSKTCEGASCLVSALSGLREVIVEVQTKLLQAAVEAGVPRFIPSDFCIDYTRLPGGQNRNLDLRREFSSRLDKASISATSILNGMFTDLLTGQAPVILFGTKRVLYWGNADQMLDFTTMEDTAAYTAAAALDGTAPRFLRIAGEESSARGLLQAAEAATGSPFRLIRAGGLGSLRLMIRMTRALFPKKREVFPPWQGMQYLHDMFSGLPKLAPLDRNLYEDIRWTSVREVLAAKKAGQE